MWDTIIGIPNVSDHKEGALERTNKQDIIFT